MHFIQKHNLKLILQITIPFIMFGLIFWVPNELIIRCVETYWSNYHKLTLHLNYPIMFQLTIII